ncbi:efflux RND transporter permease subunit, partial [Mesorhizobium sp. M7A.F.Ca.CA.004.04.2.1]|uniref:efflux RND transporter permease subunit n=1 Tax=Mesorhizobium sp. M7A.F.Ca.CA.004.04.2.1 TaxID=2496677 RepID=UPI000FD46BA3
MPTEFCAPEPAPLAIASGAGSGAQNSVGIGVMGGMIAATVIGVFLVPLLFVTVRRIFKGRAAKPDTGETPVTANQQ